MARAKKGKKMDGKLNDMMRFVGEELATFANNDAVVGSPIELGNVTVVPISRVSIALGGGGAGSHGAGKLTAKEQKTAGEGAGGASTGAARVRPIAVAVFTEKRVEVLTIPDSSRRRDKMFDMIPDLISRFTGTRGLKEEVDVRED